MDLIEFIFEILSEVYYQIYFFLYNLGYLFTLGAIEDKNTCVVLAMLVIVIDFLGLRWMFPKPKEEEA